jgi:AraC-like DNA-binding protein
MPASHLRVFVDALFRIGVDVVPLLAKVRLQRTELDNPDTYVPCSALAAVLGGAMEQRPIANLGAQLGINTPVGSFPLLDYLVLTTDNVGDALLQLQRYFHVTTAPYTLHIVEETDVVRLLVKPGTNPFDVQFATAVSLHHLRHETADKLSVEHVSLMFEAEDRTDLERLLGCPLRTSETWSGIAFPRQTMRTPLIRRDPILRAVLEGRVEAFPPGPIAEAVSAVSQVRAVLASRMGKELPDIGEIARQLAIAPRTLQRRLLAEGTSFKDLIDNTRREAAQRLLANRSLAVAEVGYLLGFSEPSAFNRAFKRWLGVAPLEYRRTIEQRRSAQQGL